MLLTATWFAIKNNKGNVEEQHQAAEEPLYNQIRFYPIEINLNNELYHMVLAQEEQLLSTLQQIREKIAFDLGFVIPEVKIKVDKKLNYPAYYLSIQGHHSAHNALHFDKVLAILSARCKEDASLPGLQVRDPSYGLPAIWIELEQQQEATHQGFTVCDPIIVLTTHLSEYINSQLPQLLTREETEQLLIQPGVKALSEELIPTLLSLSQVQRILQTLVQEKVSIRYIQHILELLLEHAKKTPDPIQLVELVRAGLAVPICQKLLLNQDNLQVLTLESSLEQKLNQVILHKEFLALEPSATEELITSLAVQVEKMLNARKRPILLCSSLLRRHLKQLTQRVIPHLTVLAMNEIPVNVQVESFGVIK